MPETRNDELYRALKHNGYPDDFCREIAYRQMNTDFTATRMLGYLYRVTSPRAEDVVDEMLAILSDRKAWIEKKQSEEAQAAISRMYREGLVTWAGVYAEKAEELEVSVRVIPLQAMQNVQRRKIPADLLAR